MRQRRVLKQVREMATPPSPETFYFVEVQRPGVFYPVNENILDPSIGRAELLLLIRDIFGNKKMLPLTFAERWIRTFGKTETVRVF